jgi:bleomycin hydrolase
MMEVDEVQLRRHLKEEDRLVSLALRNHLRGNLRYVHQRRPTIDFDHEVRKFQVTQQWSSGRCWIFAGLNMLRVMLDGRVKLPDSFELSATYLFFYHKLESINAALQKIAARPTMRSHEREFRYTMSNALQDGGDWSMFCCLVAKYGVVPNRVYGEVSANDDTDTLNQVLKCVLCEGVHEIQGGIADASARCIQRAYRVLCRMMGAPPKSFGWRIGAGDARARVALQPRQFAAEIVGFTPCGYCALVDDGRFEPGTRYCFASSVVGVGPMPLLVVRTREMIASCVESLRGGVPVWCGVDIDKHYDAENGLLDRSDWSHEETLGVNLDALPKWLRASYGSSNANHAVLMVACTSDGGQFRLENSHGARSRNDGHLYATAEWLAHNLFEAVVPSRVAPAYAPGPVLHLPYYDAMGTHKKC